MHCHTAVKNTFIQFGLPAPDSRRVHSAPESLCSAEDSAMCRSSFESDYLAFVSSCHSLSSNISTSSASPSSARDQVKEKKPPVLKLEKFAQKNEVPEDQFTTVMLRNIPCRYSQDQLLDTVKSFGIPCNFLYLAPAKTGGGNLGYAFVNFLTNQGAKEFMKVFTGVEFTHIPRCNKRAIVAWATLQGYKQNVRFYNRTKCVLTENGPRVARNARSQV